VISAYSVNLHRERMRQQDCLPGDKRHGRMRLWLQILVEASGRISKRSMSETAKDRRFSSTDDQKETDSRFQNGRVGFNV
jgi:hypothetical protein